MSSPFHRFRRIFTLSFVATMSLAAPAFADFVGISRCSVPGAASTPALHFVSGGERFIVLAGERGLTSDIIFDENAAIAWARASGLFPEGTVFGNYSDFICGILDEDIPPEPDPAPPPQEEPEQPTCEGSECEGPPRQA